MLFKNKQEFKGRYDTHRIQGVNDVAEPYSHGTKRIRMFLKFNKELERQADLIRLNESFLAEKLEELECILSVSDTIERYTLARLTELALLCAGNYANNGCIAEAGDLIFNPRLILVHIKGEHHPVKKKRHVPLTVQFKSKGVSRLDVVDWLKYNTIVETVKKPILPHLVDLLEKSGWSDSYLEFVRERISLIVSLTSRLSVSGMPDYMDIDNRISEPGENDRMLMVKLLCRFDKTVFHDLGDKIFNLF